MDSKSPSLESRTQITAFSNFIAREVLHKVTSLPLVGVDGVLALFFQSQLPKSISLISS